MGQQRVKEEKPQEIKEKKEDRGSKEKTIRKWKGKEWFTVLSPKMFGENILSETPTTDPKNLVGRNLEVSIAELTGQAQKSHMRLKFRIDRIEDKKAYTTFNGYSCVKEYIFRVIRKRLQKVEIINTINTKDNWELQFTTIAILNRNTDAGTQKSIRKSIEEYLQKKAAKSGINELVSAVMAGIYQKEMRKMGNKIYPIRFSEIAKIEVLKPGE